MIQQRGTMAMEQLSLWTEENMYIKELSQTEALTLYHTISKQAAARWNVAHAEASKAYDVAIQQDHSIQNMMVADGRYDKAMQKADAILAATMRTAYEQLRLSIKPAANGNEQPH
jgi:hypothetical protein